MAQSIFTGETLETASRKAGPNFLAAFISFLEACFEGSSKTLVGSSQSTI
jgi:hypothetical protein